MLEAGMGRSDGADVLLAAAAFDDMNPVEEDLAHWISLALDKRLDLKQLQIQEQIARKEVDRARAGHWPSLALQGSYDLNSDDPFGDSDESYTVSAVMQINLYSGQRISAQAEAMLEAARSRIQQAEAAVRQATVAQQDSLVRVPYQGQIIKKMVSEGDLASPGMPFFTIEEEGQYCVDLVLPERHIQEIKIGMSVKPDAGRLCNRRCGRRQGKPGIRHPVDAQEN
jgi:multidrug resistance efflux pump